MSKQGRPVHCGHVERCVIVAVLGVGSLLPWNFFIIASQYFHQRLAAAPNATCNATSNATCNATSGGGDYSYGLWMPLASNLPLLILSLFNTLWPSSWSGCDLPAARCKRRGLARDPLVVSSMASIIACFAVTAVLVNVAVSPRAFFIVTMATIVLINMCSGVLVGRLLGVVGLLFQQYLPWFMSGQGGSGLFAALVMLVSIVSEVDALVYFITPCIVTVITLLCYLRLLKLATSPRTHSHTRGDAVDSPLQDVAPQGPPGITDITALSSSSDAPEEGGDQKRDENLEKHCGWHVFNKIRRMALCVTAVFFVTLSVFPVITSRVRTVYKDNAAWGRAPRPQPVRRRNPGLPWPWTSLRSERDGHRCVCLHLLSVPRRQGVHLRLLLHRVQRHGPLGPRPHELCPMALEGELVASRRRGVSWRLRPSAGDDLQASRLPLPRLVLHLHHGDVLLLQRVPGEPLRGLRSTVGAG